LDAYYNGPEAIIGSPNPNVYVGTRREHCDRSNSRVTYESTNYKFEFNPYQEWEFVDSPKENENYPHTDQREEHWRKVVKLDEVMKLPQVAQYKLQAVEVQVLRLYTGPMFNLYNAVLRKFPADLYEKLQGNQYETTISCIISGILKISKKTVIPHDRRLWRGLGGMILPESFWDKNKGADGFRGGVEMGFMSTTTNREVAIQYSGSDKKRGSVFEIAAGRIDIGADIKFLSQYPGEAEYLFPPLSCLEVNGDPRIEGDVIVFPLRVNLCSKGLTLEELVKRRKVLHSAMIKNLTEELDVESSPSSLLSINAPTTQGKKEEEMLEYRSMSQGEKDEVVIKLKSARVEVLKEFEEKIKDHEKYGQEEFNVDAKYKLLTAEAIDFRSNALHKIYFYRDILLEKREELLENILRCPFEELAVPGKKEEIRTGLVVPFPWKDLVENQKLVDFGTWSPTKEQCVKALEELGKCKQFRIIKIGKNYLSFETNSENEDHWDSWAVKELNWEQELAVEKSPGTVAFVIRNCKCLTSLNLRSEVSPQNL
jgi:hypothetical protein